MQEIHADYCDQGFRGVVCLSVSQSVSLYRACALQKRLGLLGRTARAGGFDTAFANLLWPLVIATNAGTLKSPPHRHGLAASRPHSLR